MTKICRVCDGENKADDFYICETCDIELCECCECDICICPYCNENLINDLCECD